MGLAIVHSRARVGVRAPDVRVEVHLAGGLPAMSLEGRNKFLQIRLSLVQENLINHDFTSLDRVARRESYGKENSCAD